MRARSTLLLLPALLAAACNLNPTTEGGAGMAAELECSASLTYGGCVRGTASNDQHGYHTALLRRGDHIRVRLSRVDGDLNPGLALKSPKYSVAVRHESVQVRGDAVEKVWTVPSTGFYTFVAFPWSNRGTGAYQMDLICDAGPCASGPALDAEVAGACIGEARDCTLKTLGLSLDTTADAVPGIFDSCMRDKTAPVCAPVCTSDAETGPCTETVDRLRPFAGRSAQCVEQIQGCLDACVPHVTGTEPVADLSASPEMLCWAVETRSNCATFGMNLASCRDPLGETGEGYQIGSEAWCAAVCVAREGDEVLEDCTDRCAPQPNADVELPDIATAE